jgi:hypothetical protein
LISGRSPWAMQCTTLAALYPGLSFSLFAGFVDNGFLEQNRLERSPQDGGRLRVFLSRPGWLATSFDQSKEVLYRG